MNQFTFLTEEQYFGEKQIEVIQKMGTKAALTDFAILCGAYVDNDSFVENKESLENRCGWYWTKTDDGDNDAGAVNRNGA